MGVHYWTFGDQIDCEEYQYKMLKIYLDACCLNRPFDNQKQIRVRLESEAITLILSNFENGKWIWISSEVIQQEIEKNPNMSRRNKVMALTNYADITVSLSVSEVKRAKLLTTLGFKYFDALHLACAESGKASLFLTTDDRLLRRAHRFADQIKLRVENPLIWLREFTLE